MKVGELRYEEISELEEPMFAIVDINNNMWHRFYTEDLQKFMDFLIQIKTPQNLNFEKNINESYNLKYILILEDIDYGNNYNFYREDIEKIEKFLNRPVRFGVIKT